MICVFGLPLSIYLYYLLVCMHFWMNRANVDGAIFNALSTAGMGVLIRDDKGRVVGALSQNFHAPLGTLEAEAKAMEAAVLFARDLGVQDITFEGDSLQVCNFLAGSTVVPPAVANVLEGIRFHLQFFRSYAFSHVKRAGNKPAHLLAQHAKFVSSYELWVEETPSFLETVIASDASGLYLFFSKKKKKNPQRV